MIFQVDDHPIFATLHYGVNIAAGEVSGLRTSEVKDVCSLIGIGMDEVVEVASFAVLERESDLTGRARLSESCGAVEEAMANQVSGSIQRTLWYAQYLRNEVLPVFPAGSQTQWRERSSGLSLS